ncbi:type IV pilus twitching motility protein PilT [Leifsonia sp. A12D58]|uniref:type IV pilus twitching motility protein PilT n=1 Tax=Leifsonia sp. A12D58 TaxID=3397674 RepID=UPI0039E1E9F1
MDKPIFEIPVTPPGDDAEGWTPKLATPSYTPSNPDSSSPFDSILFDAPTPGLTPAPISAESGASVGIEMLQGLFSADAALADEAPGLTPPTFEAPSYSVPPAGAPAFGGAASGSFTTDASASIPAAFVPPTYDLSDAETSVIDVPARNAWSLDSDDSSLIPNTYAAPSTQPTYEIDDYAAASAAPAFSLDDLNISAPGLTVPGFTAPADFSAQPSFTLPPVDFDPPTAVIPVISPDSAFSAATAAGAAATTAAALPGFDAGVTGATSAANAIGAVAAGAAGAASLASSAAAAAALSGDSAAARLAAQAAAIFGAPLSASNSYTIPAPDALSDLPADLPTEAIDIVGEPFAPPVSAPPASDFDTPSIVPGGRRAALAAADAFTAPAADAVLAAPDLTVPVIDAPDELLTPPVLTVSEPLFTPPTFVAPAPTTPIATVAIPAPTADAASASGSAEDTMTIAERAALKDADPELVAALQEVVLQRASDLHLTVNAPPMLRVDGGLRPAGSTVPWSRDKVLGALYSLLSPLQKENFEKHLELDFAYTISANARFRVNFYQQRGAVGAAFRLIPTEIKQLKDLGVPESVGNFAKLPRGLVLVTGPTGSGKSTTLAAMIDLVNSTRADHIVTVEDPIEFLHNHKMSLVNQREVGHDTHSFAAALKHVLRQDPDVILIGELRDLETISVALTAAETGHLVFATLHTQDAPQTIDRVIDVFPPHAQDQVRAQLAATLQGVVCQTLVKKANGRGRVVATEVLMTTPAIANLIREGKTYQISSMMQAGRDSGMHTMDQHLADLVDSGQITRKAAEDKAHDPDGLSRLIHRVESPTEASARAMAASGIDFGDSYSQVVR